MIDDRTFYRLCRDEDLIEQAQVRPTAELAVVLAERLTAAPPTPSPDGEVDDDYRRRGQ